VTLSSQEEARYVQLAHNVRHPVSGHAVAQVLHSFGREDQLDRAMLGRLVGSLSRYLGADAPQLPATEPGGGAELSFLASHGVGAGTGRWTGCGAAWVWTS